jgi:hypothetical protein
VIRLYRQSDRNFVVNSWLRSFERTSRAGVWPSSEAYRAHYQPLVRGMLEDPLTVTYVRCSPEDEDHIFAYLAHRGRSLLYVYVKAIFRDRPGQQLRYAWELLARASLLSGPVSVAFWTPAWHRYAERYGLKYTHDLEVK